MRTTEQSYSSPGGAFYRPPAAINLPSTNEFYLNPPNLYEHSDSYTYVDAGRTAFLPRPSHPPPQYVPSTLQSDNSTNELYTEIQGECMTEKYQPPEKYVFVTETKLQSPLSDQGKEDNASEKPYSLVQEVCEK